MGLNSMNLLLIEQNEIQGGQVVLRGRRAQHIRSILKKEPGARLRAGIIDRGTCEATIISVDDETVVCSPGEVTPSPPPRVHVVVAVPRPKALSRLVAAGASFGLRSLTFVNAWRVEKSYFASPRLAPSRLREDALLGCEQGAQIWIPALRVARRFVHFFEDELAEVFPPLSRKLVLHPSAPSTLNQADGASTESLEDVVIALGPEGGFIERELETLQRAGFSPVRLGTGPLKTEVALAAALGQLALLRLVPATSAIDVYGTSRN